ncbi:MAG: hypothetical protein ACRESS_10845 [Stenotrophobium sp.]
MGRGRWALGCYIPNMLNDGDTCRQWHTKMRSWPRPLCYADEGFLLNNIILKTIKLLNKNIPVCRDRTAGRRMMKRKYSTPSMVATAKRRGYRCAFVATAGFVAMLEISKNPDSAVLT